MKMRPLLESEKNYITCTVMMALVGVAMLYLGKSTGAMIIFAIAICFGCMTAVMIVKNNADKELVERLIEQKELADQARAKAKEKAEAKKAEAKKAEEKKDE